MALFWQTKKGKETTKLGDDKAKKVTDVAKKPETKKAEVAKEVKESPRVIISGQTKHEIYPRITEKGTFLAEKGVYIFNIAKGVTKGAVKDAVTTLFKVHPRKVAIVNIPEKKIIYKNKYGARPGERKAYVYLKEGEKIDLV